MLLWQWVRRETRDELWAVVTAVVMLAVSEPLHNWLTHCNIDAPFLLFGMLGFYLLRFHPGQRPAVVAAALSMALSFLFKQHGLLLAASALLYLVTVDRSLAAVFATVLSVFAGLLVLMLVVRSGGWYWTAAVEIPLHSIWKEHPRFLQDLFRSPALGILALVFLAGGTAVLFRLNEGKGRLFAALFGAALVVSFLGYQKQGGARNSLLPIYVVGTLALGMAPSALQGVRPRRLCRHAVKAALLVIALVVLHLGFVGARKRAADAGWTAPWSSSRTPTYRSYSRFERRIEAAVRSLPGEVFVGARFLALEDQGRPLNFHQTALYEGTVRTSEYDVDEIIGADLAAHRYRAMIVWAYREKPFRALLERYYRKGKKLGRDPFLGMDVHVWTPR